MKISDSILYLGVNDYKIDLFEGQYSVPRGISYNSYAILDEKIAIMDAVDTHFTEEWLGNIRKALGDRKPDYLVVQHMEPDHSSGIELFIAEYPDAVIVASDKAFTMMGQFFGEGFSGRRQPVKERDVLSLGAHKLHFIAAPMVHWPEVIMSYESSEKILFSADAFGKFGGLDVDEPWDDEAARYYIGIVGKYGLSVQTVLKKAAALDIEKICPLHGPVLSDDLGHYLGLYEKWSSFTPDRSGVVICYASIYGNTRRAALTLEKELKDKGIQVISYDLARCDMHQAVADAFRYDRLVLASCTYNGNLFPVMHSFINHLTERGFKGRTVGIMENGTWAPVSGRLMKELLSLSKELTFIEEEVHIKSAANEKNLEEIKALAAALNIPANK